MAGVAGRAGVGVNLRWWVLVFGIVLPVLTFAAASEGDANRALRKIGIGPGQSEPFAALYDQFLRKRNMAVRRVLNSRSGEEVDVMARKRVRRAAKKSVKQMGQILTEQQLKYYEEFLKVSNELFLRRSGLG